MYRQRETNPHFLPRQSDPVLDFTPQTRPPRSRPQGRTSVEPPHGPTPQPPTPESRTSIEPPHGPRPQPPTPESRTSIEPPHGPRPQPPIQQPQPQVKPPPPDQVDARSQPRQESRPQQPHSQPLGLQPSGGGQHSAPHGHAGDHHHHPSFLRAPMSRRTRPVAWLVAAFCTLFWIIIIVGGLIILIVYLVFRPRSPRFDLSTGSFNAAYLDMGYLLNADVTLLANFTNPNTKVNIDFSYVILDLYYEKNFIATRYIEPFSVMRMESRFTSVHMVASQVRLSMAHSMALQRQMEGGRVNFEIRGMFRTRSKLGGLLHYSYWLYAHCEIVVTGPPTGVLIGKKCETKR
ncbi:hypothetical protein Salat_1276300 [Sesamum alatum]|uniref:Late embryogenesis abundant protein LEA-2 subgroup domain-containing protein n=1 Tax=Sesamum alatum TaxID=300844 RepID=A0AAE1YGT1_9LAMI|nr:hypothetical protein Salat_1276300 [Sesamum alatum]